jgi:hypothetical protein
MQSRAVWYKSQTFRRKFLPPSSGLSQVRKLYDVAELMAVLQGLLLCLVVATLALAIGTPAEPELLEESQPKETLKAASSYGYGYGYGLYGGYPYGFGHHGLYGWGKQALTCRHRTGWCSGTVLARPGTNLPDRSDRVAFRGVSHCVSE